MFLLGYTITTPTIYQEEGTATTSFISESLQTVDAEKMTLEDEEAFMDVAIQMYNGMCLPCNYHSRPIIVVLYDDMLI